jgi:hypothetical protein
MSAFNTIVSVWWWADRDSVEGVWLRERAMMDLRCWDNHVHFVDKTATFPAAEELAESWQWPVADVQQLLDSPEWPDPYRKGSRRRSPRARSKNKTKTKTKTRTNNSPLTPQTGGHRSETNGSLNQPDTQQEWVGSTTMPTATAAHLNDWAELSERIEASTTNPIVQLVLKQTKPSIEDGRLVLTIPSSDWAEALSADCRLSMEQAAGVRLTIRAGGERAH